MPTEDETTPDEAFWIKEVQRRDLELEKAEHDRAPQEELDLLRARLAEADRHVSRPANR